MVEIEVWEVGRHDESRRTVVRCVSAIWGKKNYSTAFEESAISTDSRSVCRLSIPEVNLLQANQNAIARAVIKPHKTATSLLF